MTDPRSVFNREGGVAIGQAQSLAGAVAVGGATILFRCKAFDSSATVSIPNNAFTSVPFNSESYQTPAASIHSTGVNPSRFTIPAGAGGVWMFSGEFVIAANATGVRAIGLAKNGTVIAQGSRSDNPSAAQLAALHICVSDEAAAGDFYEIQIFQNSGGALTNAAGGTNALTYGIATRLGS